MSDEVADAKAHHDSTPTHTDLITVRKEFSWYFDPPASVIEDIWKNGLLTVDTNVLLHLYRYHQNTRDSLLSSLSKFKGRLWLSRQAAEEFFRNRTSVIISSAGEYETARGELKRNYEALTSTIGSLRTRLVPDSEAAEAELNIKAEIEKLSEKITKAELERPDFLNADAVLDKLCELFDGVVGPAQSPSDIATLRKEGEQRQIEKIPPGYLDKGKDAGRGLGDFFLWKQVLIHAKSSQKPIILVTSDEKEDWWERHQGRTLRPRMELTREALEFSGQTVLIYRTERFLKQFHEYFGGTVDPAVLSEVAASRSIRGATVFLSEFSQDVRRANDIENIGSFSVVVNNPVLEFPLKGVFEPSLCQVPGIRLEISESPDPDLQYELRVFRISSAVFGITVRVQGVTRNLPIGKYVINYHASLAFGVPPRQEAWIVQSPIR